MKPRYLFSLLAMVALLCGCSADAPQQRCVASSDEVEITLSLKVNAGLSTATRTGETDENYAPRDIVCWHGQQSINDMRIYVFSSDNPKGPYLYYGGGDCPDGAFSVPYFNNEYPWNGGSELYNQNFQQCRFTFRPKLGSGRYYRFLAVGRDDKTGDARPTRPIDYVHWGTKVFGEPNVKVGVTDIDNVTLTNLLNFTHYPFVTTEIFSGQSEGYVYVDPKITGFNTTVELTRAVAGFWFYVTAIPTMAVDNSGRVDYDGFDFFPNELTVYLTCASNTLDLSNHCDGGSSDDNYSRTIQIGYVDFTNRYGQKENRAWHKSPGDLFWQRDQIDSYRGMTITANSALMSGFIIPIDETHLLDSDMATITLQLRERETDYTFRKQMKCNISQQMNPANGGLKEYVGDPCRFPIVANCLYALGDESMPYSLARFGDNRTRSLDEEPLTCTVIGF